MLMPQINPAKFFTEVKAELSKVTWPTKSQTINYSLLVLAISLFLAAFIGLADFGLSLGMEKLIATQTAQAPIDNSQSPTPTTQTLPIEANAVQATDSNGNPINVQVK